MQIIAYRANGSVSNIERVFLYKDSGATAGTEGDPITGLTNSSTGLSIATVANNEATANVDTSAATSSIETVTTLGTYATPTAGFVRFREVDATNMPGLYELQWENARYAVSSAKYLDVVITGVADLATSTSRIYLDVIDAADIDQVLQDYDSSAGVASNTDLNARTLATAVYPTLTTMSTLTTTVTDGDASIEAKILAYIRLLCRSDGFVDIDNATELTAINADGGSGAGNYDPEADSLEATQDDITAIPTTAMRGTDDAALATALTTAQNDLDTITGSDGVIISTASTTTIAQGTWSEVLGNTTMSASALVQIIAGVNAGLISGAATTTVTIRDIEDAANLVVATVDINGNRSAITIITPST